MRRSPAVRASGSRGWEAYAAALALVLAGAVGCGPEQTGRDVGGADPEAGWRLDERDTGAEPPDTRPPRPDTADTSQDDGAPTGAACKSFDQCRGGACIATENYPGGYCTKIGCRQTGCSGADAVCVEFRDGATGCLDGCRMHGDCRDGYSCQQAHPDGTTACLPGKPPPPPTFGESKEVLGVECNPERIGPQGGGTAYRFEFSLTDKASAFLMVPFVNGGALRPTRLKTPRQTRDLTEGYKYHNTRVSDVYESSNMTGLGTFGKIAMGWPILVPYAPRHAAMVRPGGTYELEVVADADRPCLYVVENRPGRKIDLNLYFVGTPGLDARTARMDPDLQEVLERFRHIYGKADIALDTVRYFDVPEKVADRYRRVTSRGDAQRLMAYGKPPAGTREGHLSVDVFLVQDLNFNRGGQGDVLGMSAGLPGAAGLHGNARNGLVFQTTDLGFDNDHVGHIMAHEIGHFLGLRHTTEVVHDTSRASRYERILGTTDPIKDTAICSNITDRLQRDPRTCNDFDNLMFPVAPPPRLDIDPRLTEGQSQTLRANPLVGQ